LLKTLCILTTFFCVFNAQATIIVVENVNNAGVGSLRDAVASASTTANDTILINIKGTISLDSPLDFDSFTALMVIGPYAKHNRITAGGVWTSALFKITNSGGIIFRNLGFDNGNGNTRHIKIENCADEILFERCIFQNNNLTLLGQRGGSVAINASYASFSQCLLLKIKLFQMAVH
jgi:pectate lyase